MYILLYVYFSRCSNFGPALSVPKSQVIYLLDGTRPACHRELSWRVARRSHRHAHMFEKVSSVPPMARSPRASLDASLVSSVALMAS